MLHAGVNALQTPCGWPPKGRIKAAELLQRFAARAAHTPALVRPPMQAAAKKAIDLGLLHIWAVASRYKP